MTLNEVNIIKNSVLDATEAYVDARLSSSDFVKTQIGVVQGDPTLVNGKYRHTVVCNKTTYSAGVTYTDVLSVGNNRFPNKSVVFLIAPNAQYSNQFILGKLDSTPVTIVGGTIHIGEIPNTDPLEYYFSVEDNGNVTIKSGSIKLIKDTRFPSANWYHISLDTNGIKLGHQNTNQDKYNFTVNQNGNVKIYDGSIQLGLDTGSYYHVNLDSNGLKLGHKSSNSYYFTVTSDGEVTISKGSLNINSGQFKVDTDGTVTIKRGSLNINSGQFEVASNGTVTIKSGSINISSGNFEVATDGTVTIKKGSLNINNGQFKVDTDGTVTIKRGSMNINSKFYVDTSGNLFIGGTTSSSANFHVTSSDGTVTIKKGSINLGTSTATSSGNAFSVTNAGYLESVSGKIGGFTIQSNYIGDAMGSTDAVGMKAGECLYAYSPSHFAKIDKGMITTAGDQGDPSRYPYCYYAYSGVNSVGAASGSYLRMSSANVFSSARNDTVAWLQDLSDKRLKKDISEISFLDVRTLFSKIKPSKFKFKKHAKDYDEKKEDNNIHFGIIAQELKDALESSNLLTESIVKERKCTEDDDILTVNYSEFHGLELAGIKDLYNIVKDQQEQINALKAQIEEENNG